MVEKKSLSWYNFILIAVIIICIGLIIFQNIGSITGHATEGTTVSNVTISYYLSIAMSSNLTHGIIFGDIASLPATDINSSHNYDGASDATTLYLNVSLDSNTNVDFCTKSNTHLTSGVNTIGVGNETYSNSTATNATNPYLSQDVLLTTGYVKAGGDIDEGTANYYRFWLDIPAAQASGDYNNTVSFKGVRTGQGC